MSVSITAPIADAARFEHYDAIIVIMRQTFDYADIEFTFLPSQPGDSEALYRLDITIASPDAERPVNIGRLWAYLVAPLEAADFRLDGAKAANLSGSDGHFELTITDLRVQVNKS